MRVVLSPKKPADKRIDWHRADIKAALEKSGWTIRQLAAHHKLAESTLRGALSHKYPASERRIAKAIGVPPKAIWPSRYDQAGEPITRRSSGRVSRNSGADRSTGVQGRHAKCAGSN